MSNPIWTAKVATATSNMQSFATAADRAGMVFGPGEVTYLIDQKTFEFWDGTAWKSMGGGGGAAALQPCLAGLSIDNGNNWNDVQSSVSVPFGQTNPTYVSVTTMPINQAAGTGVRGLQGSAVAVGSGVLSSWWGTSLTATNMAGTQVWGGTITATSPLAQGQTVLTWSPSSWLLTGTDLHLSANSQTLLTTAGGIFVYSLIAVFNWQ